MNYLLGVSGFAGSGKDTLADYLVGAHGWAGKISFARNLKDIVKHTFKLTEHQVSSHEGKKQHLKGIALTPSHVNAILTWMCRTHDTSGLAGRKAEIREYLKSIYGKNLLTPREILQFVGTDICRYIIPTYHIDVLDKKLQQCEGNWVITDVRFPDEAEMVQKLNGLLIRVERPSLSHSEEHRHSSETALHDWNKWNSIIVNDTSSVEDLYTKIDKFLEENKLCRKTTQL